MTLVGEYTLKRILKALDENAKEARGLIADMAKHYSGDEGIRQVNLSFKGFDKKGEAEKRSVIKSAKSGISSLIAERPSGSGGGQLPGSDYRHKKGAAPHR